MLSAESEYYHTTGVSVRSEDILYNSYSFAVSQTSTTTSTTSPPLTEKKQNPAPAKAEGCGHHHDHHHHHTPGSEEEAVLVMCDECGAELGSLEDELVHFWSDVVTFRREAGGEIIFSNQDVTNAEDCFKMIVSSFVEQSFMTRPRFLLRNRNDEFLLLWIMDRNLPVLQTGDQGVAVKNVLKVLFRLVDDRKLPELHDLECINISNKLMTAGLGLLKRSTENLPDMFKFANNYQVSYFDKS